MFARFLTLSLGLALCGVSPAFAQGPAGPRPGPSTFNRSHAPTHHAKAKHRHKHRHKHCHGSKARSGASNRDGKVLAAMMKLHAAQRELAALGMGSSPRGFGSSTSRGGPPARSEFSSGGFGGGLAVLGTGSSSSQGFGSSTSRGGLGTRGFGGGVASSLSGGPPRPASGASANSETAQLRKELAELRASVNQLAEIVRKDRR